MIVCLEGIDGAGKQTQAKMLFSYLRMLRKDIDVTVIPHPDYASEHGKLIKSYLHGSERIDPKALFLTFLADIAKDSEKITEASKRGVVILDRYHMSTVAYQSAGGFDYEKAKIITLLMKLPQPDKLFYLDIRPEDSLTRKMSMGQGLDRHEKDIAFLGKVRGFYLQEIRDRFPDNAKWIVLDAMEKKEQINEMIVSEVNRSFKKLKR